MHFELGNKVTLELMASHPYETYQNLIEHEPISYSGPLGMWLLTRYEDVVSVLANTKTFRNTSEHSLLSQTFGPMMLSSDGSVHKRMRDPFMPYFQPNKMRELATPVIERLTDNLIDQIITDEQANIDAAVSEKLALYVVTAMVGLPIKNYDEFAGIFDGITAGLANFRQNKEIKHRAETSFLAFKTIVQDQIEKLKVDQDPSLLGQLINNSDHDLTEDEIVSNLGVTIFGGLETTAALLSNSLWCLFQHSEQLEAVKLDYSLIPNSLEESLRFESPVQTCTRHISQTIEMRGMTIQKGETVQCLLGAANRDPDIFEQPQRFNIQRNNAKKHLGFGRGVHYCLGASLARLEGVIALPIIFERLKGLELINEKAEAPSGHEFRSTPSLWMRWKN